MLHIVKQALTVQVEQEEGGGLKIVMFQHKYCPNIALLESMPCTSRLKVSYVSDRLASAVAFHRFAGEMPQLARKLRLVSLLTVYSNEASHLHEAGPWIL